MAPRSKANGADTDADASMSDVPDHRVADDMVSFAIGIHFIAAFLTCSRRLTRRPITPTRTQTQTRQPAVLLAILSQMDENVARRQTSYDAAFLARSMTF